MTRVAVIGNAGGGKSSLCRQLSTVRGLPYYPIDKIQWRPGWSPVPEKEFTAAHAEILARPTWIIDSFGPWTEIEKRFDMADTIILVDHPLWLHYWWATKRQVVSIFRGRPDGPEAAESCPMLPVTFLLARARQVRRLLTLYRVMWRRHRDVRPVLLAAIERRRSAKRIFHIRSPRALAEFRTRYCLQ